MRPIIRICAVALAVAAVLSLAGCGDDATPAPVVTVTSTVSVAPAAPSTSDPSDGQPAQPISDPSEDAAEEPAPAPPPCGPRALAPSAIDAAIATLTRTGATWHVIGSNFSTCNNISYVALDTVGTATPAPYQLLIFDKAGTFLGTGIKCDVLYQQVVDSGPDFVVVRYNYDGQGQVMGSQTGAAYAMFRWNGTRVVMDGTLPTEVTYKNC